jgi:hypothetical protein
MDVSNTQLVRQVCKDYEITTVYHLASLLSELQKDSNNSLGTECRAATEFSGIGKEGLIKKGFGQVILRFSGKEFLRKMWARCSSKSQTVYGITKMAGEKWCEYYHEKIRSRY